jgi:hypothetical protein
MNTTTKVRAGQGVTLDPNGTTRDGAGLDPHG